MAADICLTPITCILVLTFCVYSLTALEFCEEELFFIKSVGPYGLTFDATDPNQVKVEFRNNSAFQSWKFENSGRPGSYYIINEHHGKVMDFVEDKDGTLRLVVKEKDDHSMRQRWHLSAKGQLTNFANGKNVDVKNENYNPGTLLHLRPDKVCPCQVFHLQAKTSVNM